MISRVLVFTGVLLLDSFPANSAPVCVLNQSGQQLFLVVDDLAGRRVSGLMADQGQLCLEGTSEVEKAVVGVFASVDALEGCSRLTRPDQIETLLEFAEFDNCRWAETDRAFD